MTVDEFSMQRLSTPTVLPVDLFEAKHHLEVEHHDDNSKITRMIGAGVAFVEEYTRRSLVRQQWRLYFDFSLRERYLPRGPVQSIERVQYIDSDGATQTLATSVYELDRARNTLLLTYDQVWPATRHQMNAAWIDYWSGYYEPANSPIDLVEDIPEDLRSAVLYVVAHQYEHRGELVQGFLKSDPMLSALMTPHKAMQE